MSVSHFVWHLINSRVLNVTFYSVCRPNPVCWLLYSVINIVLITAVRLDCVERTTRYNAVIGLQLQRRDTTSNTTTMTVERMTAPGDVTCSSPAALTLYQPRRGWRWWWSWSSAANTWKRRLVHSRHFVLCSQKRVEVAVTTNAGAAVISVIGTEPSSPSASTEQRHQQLAEQFCRVL